MYCSGLLNRYVKCVLRMRRECPERFPRYRLQRKPLVSDPDMHHVTCVTHMPWCMSSLLTCGGGENVPSISGACATRNITYLARNPWAVPSVDPSANNVNTLRTTISDVFISWLVQYIIDLTYWLGLSCGNACMLCGNLNFMQYYFMQWYWHCTGHYISCTWFVLSVAICPIIHLNLFYQAYVAANRHIHWIFEFCFIFVS